MSGPSNWDGWNEFTHGVDDGPATFPQSLLRDASPASAGVTVTLPFDRVPPPGTTINLDVAYQNWIELTYGRQFRVDTDVNGDGTVTDDQMLIFSVPNQTAQIHLTGLGQPAAAIYEITKSLGGPPSPARSGSRGCRRRAPRPRTPSISSSRRTARSRRARVRRFAVATVTASAATGDLAPASVKADVDSNLHSPATGADWLVIANASFLDAGAGSAWQQLVARRAAQGLRVRVVDVEDVYDEFSYGIQDPEAIRSFISYVYASWPRLDPAVPLKYVVLLGDASYDFKNGMGNAQNRNLLSTYPRTVSQSTVLGWMSDETYFSTVSGSDSLPDVYLGRWPVHSVAETNAIAQKILNYEALSAPASYQSWMSDVVFLADDEAAFEEVQNQQILDYLLGTAHTWHKTYEARVGASTGLTGAALAAEVKDRIQRQLNGTVEPAQGHRSGRRARLVRGARELAELGEQLLLLHDGDVGNRRPEPGDERREAPARRWSRTAWPGDSPSPAARPPRPT